MYIHSMTSDAAEPTTSPTSADSPASAAESVDTEPLERAQQAIDEGHEAADKALDPPPDDEDLDFRNTETNDDPEAADNAVPRPN